MGFWFCKEYLELFYIVSFGYYVGGVYYYVMWSGISGDFFYVCCDGVDFFFVINEWFDCNICCKGLLGVEYLYWEFFMEGDMFSFFGLI